MNMHHNSIDRHNGKRDISSRCFSRSLPALLSSLAVSVAAQTVSAPVASSAVLQTSTLASPAQPVVNVPVDAPSASPTGSAEGCRILTDRAMSADLRAATAQSQKAEAGAQIKLLDESIGLWTLATERCDGRSLDRARRNLDDSRRNRQAFAADSGNAPECHRNQKDANTLQDLAAQALKERRWQDAALLYRKAESQWDVTAERCTGEAQRLAEQRREQTAVDAHNAAHCAPPFEKAREAGLTLRREGPSLSSSDKTTRSQVVETLWRDAMGHCKGPALDAARNNANAVAKDRGTPWLPTNDGGKTAATPHTPNKGTPSALPTQRQTSSTTHQAMPPPVAAVGHSTPTHQDIDISAGTNHFTGRFIRNGDLLSGTGRVTFGNGDVFNGALVNGQREGQGEMVWANGQRYRGDWAGDIPKGHGVMQFANGNRYEGGFSAGMAEGQGTTVFASGDRFVGLHSKGRPDGHGIYTWANGQAYQGAWTKDQPNGQGKLTFANGNRYEGQFVNGLPHGAGQLVYASGETYEGLFAQGAPHGQGRYTWVNQDHYQGSWVNGQKHGQGRFEWSNGDHWVGLFENDAQTDQGTLTRKAP